VLRPHRGRFLVGMVAALVGGLFDAATLVILQPLFNSIFGAGDSLLPGDTRLQRLLDGALQPLVSDATPELIRTRLVALFLAALVLKNIANYVSAYLSVQVQESVVRDLRTRLFAHLLRLDLGVFQRTRGGQLTTGLINDADQVKLVVVAALAAFFQNAVMIVGMLAVMFGTRTSAAN
jgi:ABC-type multidrug transport system fused ATPase/permease subunit